MKKLFGILFVFAFLTVNQEVTAQEFFVTQGETVIYKVNLDESIQGGTVSDALQNLPGVRVEVDGKINLRGVSKVEVFINDQPTHFSNDARKNYIQQTPASEIMEIQVMANPSAQYTTESNTGIINIITKQEKNTRHTLSVGYQNSNFTDHSPWLSYGYGNDKLTITANVKGTFYDDSSHSDTYGYSYADQNHNDTLNVFRNHNIKEARNSNLNFDIQLNYKFDKKNFLDFYVVGVLSKQKNTAYDSTYRKDSNQYQYVTNSNYDFLGLDGRIGMAYKHLFNDQGHALSLNVNTIWMPGETTKISERHYNIGDVIDRTTRERNIYSDFHWDAKVEYTMPYSKNGNVYVAFMKTHRPDGNQLLFDSLVGGTYVRDTLRTEVRNYYSDKNEILLNLQHHFGRFTVKPGVDLEYTTLKGVFPNEHWYDFSKTFIYAHPSLYLTYATESQHNFSVGYTHKTDYPYVRKFSPRILYQEDSYDVGNPDLKPASTHVFKAEWTKYWKKFGSVGVNAYYKGSSDYINDIQLSSYDPIYGRYVTYNLPINLGGYYDAGGEFNITYRPTAMLNVRFYANLYNSHLELPLSQDEIVKSDMFCYNLTMNIWTKLWKRLELYASAYYNSKTQALYSYTQTPYSFDCGMRMDFFKNRLSLLIDIEDLFDWNRTDNSINQPYYEYYSTEKKDIRAVSVEIIYRIL